MGIHLHFSALLQLHLRFCTALRLFNIFLRPLHLLAHFPVGVVAFFGVVARFLVLLGD